MYLSEFVNADCLTEAQIDSVLFDDCTETAVKSDFALLLGTDPKFAAIRADIAAAYYRLGGTEKIIVSGAAVWNDKITESAYLRNELQARGVPDCAVIEEPNAYDTMQNMVYSLAEICKRCDVTRVNSVTVITEPFHMRRSLYLAKMLFPAFIRVNGFTQKIKSQRKAWKSDLRLNRCVKNEITILKDMIERGMIEDIEISEGEKPLCN